MRDMSPGVGMALWVTRLGDGKGSQQVARVLLAVNSHQQQVHKVHARQNSRPAKRLSWRRGGRARGTWGEGDGNNEVSRSRVQ